MATCTTKLAEQPVWRKASFCQLRECVEVARQNGMISMRNSREPAGRILQYTDEEWESFVRSVKAGEFDDLG